MKSIVIVAIVAVAGFLAWQNFPGLRTSISKAANEYGGWTEEARKEDPVGFIQHAQKKLAADIEKFEEARDSLDENKRNAETQLESFRNDEANADQLANKFRDLYQDAEASGAWPVDYLGQSYNREALIQQVTDLRTTQTNATELQAKYVEVITKVELTREELRDRISKSKFQLQRLEAEEAIVKVEKLTSDTEELLAQVNELVEGNSRIAEDPVRTVAELLDAAEKQASAEEKTAASTGASSDTMDFLNARPSSAATTSNKDGDDA
ncbi:MAG: hypothetical protein AAF957_02420 [Planctomycetota bacterium]